MKTDTLPPPTPLTVQAALAETSLRTQEQWDAYQSDTRYAFLGSRSRILRDHIQAVAEELEAEAKTCEVRFQKAPYEHTRAEYLSRAADFRRIRARLLGLEVQP